jgi:hypothetical protein
VGSQVGNCQIDLCADDGHVNSNTLCVTLRVLAVPIAQEARQVTAATSGYSNAIWPSAVVQGAESLHLSRVFECQLKIARRGFAAGADWKTAARVNTSIDNLQWPGSGTPTDLEGERQGPAAPHRAALVAVGALAAPGLAAVALAAVGAFTGTTPAELGSLHARHGLAGTDSPLPAANAGPLAGAPSPASNALARPLSMFVGFPSSAGGSAVPSAGGTVPAIPAPWSVSPAGTQRPAGPTTSTTAPAPPLPGVQTAPGSGPGNVGVPVAGSPTTPVLAGTTPPVAGTTPPVAGTTPAVAGTTPAVAGTTPAATGTTPTGTGTTPTGTGTTPTDTGATSPRIGSSTPAGTGATPTGSGANPPAPAAAAPNPKTPRSPTPPSDTGGATTGSSGTSGKDAGSTTSTSPSSSSGSGGGSQGADSGGSKPHPQASSTVPTSSSSPSGSSSPQRPKHQD